MRRKPRLGSWWGVTGVRTELYLPEYADEPDGPENTGTESWTAERPGRTFDSTEACRNRRCPRPSCGKPAPIYQVVRRRLPYLSYTGYGCILDVGVPKLGCQYGKHRLPFLAARENASFTKVSR